MRWISDDDFIRGNVPMTKFDIRIAAIAALEIEKGDEFLDIGAGTGSISIEAALQGANVISVEKEEEALELIFKNGEKFNANINLVKGTAPVCLPAMSFNKCFIGGSEGHLKEIFEYLKHNLVANGILCASFIRLKNLNEFILLLEEYDYRNIEVKLLQTAKMDKLGLLKGNNPIFLAKGIKN